MKCVVYYLNVSFCLTVGTWSRPIPEEPGGADPTGFGICRGRALSVAGRHGLSAERPFCAGPGAGLVSPTFHCRHVFHPISVCTVAVPTGCNRDRDNAFRCFHDTVCPCGEGLPLADAKCRRLLLCGAREGGRCSSRDRHSHHSV